VEDSTAEVEDSAAVATDKFAPNSRKRSCRSKAGNALDEYKMSEVTNTVADCIAFLTSRIRRRSEANQQPKFSI
jgi:hypothetical protein